MTWLSLILLLVSGQSGMATPPIGTIDFYGLRTVSETRARQALQLKAGDMVPDSPVAPQLRLQALPGVTQARLNFVCCEKGKATLYVGIQEQGAPSLDFRAAPAGAVRLPFDVPPAG